MEDRSRGRLAYFRIHAISIIRPDVVFAAENKVAAGWPPVPPERIYAGGRVLSLCADAVSARPGALSRATWLIVNVYTRRFKAGRIQLLVPLSPWRTPPSAALNRSAQGDTFCPSAPAYPERFPTANSPNRSAVSLRGSIPWSRWPRLVRQTSRDRSAPTRSHHKAEYRDGTACQRPPAGASSRALCWHGPS